MNSSDEENGSVEFDCNLPPGFPPSLRIPNAVNIIQVIIALLSALVGLPLNVYLLIAIRRVRAVWIQRSFKLSIQIIIVEIIYYCVVPITIMTSGISGRWVFGKVLCNITGMVHDAFAMFRFSMTLVFTLDRFIYIFRPFLYAKHGGILICSLTCLMWVLSLVRVIVPLHGVLDCYTYIPTFKTCTVFSGCSHPCEIFAAVSIAHIVFTGVVLSLILYIAMFIKIKLISNRQRNINSVKDEDVKKRIQNAFVLVQKSKKKLITIFLLLISIAGGTAPAFTLYIISLFYRAPNAAIFITNMLFGRTFFNLIPVFDAIAIMRHEDIKKEVFKSMKLLKSKVCN